MSFVHLHCHSEYSLLDGANRIDDLIARALEFEQPALAITDHGNLHAAWEFQEKAKKAGLRPIIGMEAYVAPGDRRSRTRSGIGERNYYHLILLAQNLAGYRNLVKLSSLAYTEGFYGKPRMDRELLARYSEGIVVSSACMAGEIATHLLADRPDEARKAAEWYADVFKDRYYLEVQAHEAGAQRELNERVFKLAAELSLPVVATNDAHFLRAEDHDSHDILLCIGLKKDRSDADRMRYDNGLYFKSAPEIRAHFEGRPDVLENTLAIADTVDVQFGKKYHVPSFPLPKGVKTENQLLVQMATDGAVARYGNPMPREVRERLDYELEVITKTGYAGYFLIVADFIQAARDRGIPVGPGRGSAAGSIVAYALKITDVCPLKYDLLFERFLNPERVSMPDIDVDFCEERRGEVIDYVRDKYGRDSVGQIITFGTLKSRAALKDVGRVLGFTPGETDAIAKLVPNAPNYSLTVKEAISKVPEVRKLYEQDERHQQLFDFAIALEGLSRHAGIHAAGIVIAPGPLDEYVPICTQESKGSGSGSDERVVVTQYDMNQLEKAGMLKMDFLGLTTLTVIHDALVAIKARRGVDVDLDAIPYDDEATFRMLRAGRTAGVFQFESPLATDMVRSMRADSFDDLVAANALMRPGPLDAGMHKTYCRRKKGEEPVSYQLPELEEILKPTFGVITYQEQVMRIAQRLAGISLAEADVLRKAVGKKDAALIKKELGKFVEKAIGRGFDKKIIEDIAGQIETFGRYGFNKSHSVAYSVLSYQTAYLKAHYPAEFMAALLSACIGDTDSVVKYINEARDLGLEILPPTTTSRGTSSPSSATSASASASAPSATSGTPPSTPSSMRAPPSPSRRCTTCASASTCARATSASSRRSRTPAPSTGSGTARSSPPRSMAPCSPRRCCSTRRRRARGRCSATTAPPRRPGTRSPPRSPPSPRCPRAPGCRRKRRSSASTSRATRSSRSAPRSSCWPRTRWPGSARGRNRRSPSAWWSPPSSARFPRSRGPSSRASPSRISRGRARCSSSPRPGPPSATACSPTSPSSSRAGTPSATRGWRTRRSSSTPSPAWPRCAPPGRSPWPSSSWPTADCRAV